MFRLGADATGRKMKPSGVCPLRKELGLNGRLGVETGRIALV
jgi:hypothetical protein